MYWIGSNKLSVNTTDANELGTLPIKFIELTINTIKVTLVSLAELFPVFLLFKTASKKQKKY